MAWWLWMLLGLGLLVLEVATPGGFVAFFFGLAGLLLGLLVLLGWAGPLELQWLLFSGLSIGALVLLRKPLQARLGTTQPTRAVDSLVGETALALDDIAVGEIGKAELRGSTWTARNGGAAAIVRGRRVMVERVEGLTLWVHSE
jgi:inner membrane protein